MLGKRVRLPVVSESREDGIAMSLFDGKPLHEKDTPDIHGRFRRQPVTRSVIVEIVIEFGDSMCKHEWMRSGEGNRFCIYCHRKVRVEKS